VAVQAADRCPKSNTRRHTHRIHPIVSAFTLLCPSIVSTPGNPSIYQARACRVRQKWIWKVGRFTTATTSKWQCPGSGVWWSCFTFGFICTLRAQHRVHAQNVIHTTSNCVPSFKHLALFLSLTPTHFHITHTIDTTTTSKSNPRWLGVTTKMAIDAAMETAHGIHGFE
jgi:hypothetical protein